MKNIKLLIGISGSGKSTYSHELWETNPSNFVIINRDKIRELLFGYTESDIHNYYKRNDIVKLEKKVTKYEDTLIYEALEENKTVILDATHLEKKYIERHEYWNVPIELVWFDVDLDTAIERDSIRNRKVGKDIITKQYNKYINLKKSFRDYNFIPYNIKCDLNLPPCVLYDIDGTIARMHNRGPFEWNKVKEDYMIYQVVSTIDWLSDLDSKNRPTVILCTGRDGIALDDTVEWLNNNKIYYDDIMIRNEKDMRPDWVVKEEMWKNISEKYNIIAMYDDRLQVVRRARALGLKVFNVEYNNV